MTATEPNIHSDLTIDAIKKMTDWPRTLNCRSVYAVSAQGTHRIIGIGRKFVRIMSRGRIHVIRPETITEIRGL